MPWQQHLIEIQKKMADSKELVVKEAQEGGQVRIAYNSEPAVHMAACSLVRMRQAPDLKNQRLPLAWGVRRVSTTSLSLTTYLMLGGTLT